MSDYFFIIDSILDFFNHPVIWLWVKRFLIFNTLGGILSVLLYSFLLYRFIKKIHPKDTKAKFFKIYKGSFKTLPIIYFFGWLSIFYIIKENKGWEKDFSALVAKRRNKTKKGYDKKKHQSSRR